MRNYRLTNPVVVGKEKFGETSASSPLEAANKFFQTLATKIKNENQYKFLFTFLDTSSNKTYHFCGKGTKNVGGGKGKGSLSIKKYQLPSGDDVVREDVLGVSQLHGGHKRRKSKKRRSGKRKSRRADTSLEEYGSLDGPSHTPVQSDWRYRRALEDEAIRRKLLYNIPPKSLYYYNPLLYSNIPYSNYILDSSLSFNYLSLPLFPFDEIIVLPDNSEYDPHSTTTIRPTYGPLGTLVTREPRSFY